MLLDCEKAIKCLFVLAMFSIIVLNIQYFYSSLGYTKPDRKLLRLKQSGRRFDASAIATSLDSDVTDYLLAKKNTKQLEHSNVKNTTLSATTKTNMMQPKQVKHHLTVKHNNSILADHFTLKTNICAGTDASIKHSPVQTPILKTKCAFHGNKMNKRCRDTCCIECALQVPNLLTSPQAQAFRKKVNTAGTVLTMVTIGNSVARENNYRTMRQFQEAMTAQYKSTTWKLNLNKGITGGVSQQGMYQNLKTQKATHFHNADVIVIQYSIFATCKNCAYAEELLRTLLELKSKPLIMLIGHVGYGGFRTDINKKENISWENRHDLWERVSIDEGGLASHYNLPFVSMSAAIKSMLIDNKKKEEMYVFELEGKYGPEKGRCLGKEKHINKMKIKNESALRPSDILHHFYNDHLHFSTLGNALAGCLLADLANSIVKSNAPITNAVSRYQLPLPYLKDTKARMGEEANLVSEFINSTVYRNLFPIAFRKFESAVDFDKNRHFEGKHSSLYNFQFKKGGRGGKKIWLDANSPGSTINFITPKPCTEILLEYYKHHELGMGIAEIKVDGKVTATIDACCKNTCIDNGDGVKRGFYYITPIAKELDYAIHKVEIKVIRRHSTRVCEKDGNQFNIISVIGNTNKKIEFGKSQIRSDVDW